MGFFTFESVIVGALVGVVWSVFQYRLYRIPRILWDYAQMWRLATYTNFDRIAFLQLSETGGQKALIGPMTTKLAEHGILLAWRTERSLKALQEAQKPLPEEDFADLMRSLWEYRGAVGMMAGRIGGLVWHSGDILDSAPDERSGTVFTSIRREWREYYAWTEFMAKFARRYGRVPIERL